MATALVSGTGERAERLRAAGHQVSVLAPEAVSVPEPDTIDHYLQLPVAVALVGDNLVARVHSFLTNGLLARFGQVEQLLPGLRSGASVVLVAGNTAAGAAVPDDQHSRLALLHVLAHAARAELAGRNVRVQVIGVDRSDDELVRFLLEGGEDTGVRLLDVSTIPSGRQYEDWRTEMMGLRSPITA